MALPDWWQPVDRIFAQAGVPTSVWAAIAGKESTLSPFASNTKLPDNSWGLFQLNRNGGQGVGYTSDYLVDPINNAMIAVKYIGPAVKKCGADNIACIAVNSGHPGPVPTNDQRIRDIVANFNAIRGKNGVDTYNTLTGGKVPPGPPVSGTDPTQPTPGNKVPKPDNWPDWLPWPDIELPSLPDPTTIGTSIGQGVFDAIKNSLHGIVTGFEQGGIDSAAPIALTVAGVALVATGVFAAVMRSDTGRTVVRVGAETGAAAL